MPRATSTIATKILKLPSLKRFSIKKIHPIQPVNTPISASKRINFIPRFSTQTRLFHPPNRHPLETPNPPISASVSARKPTHFSTQTQPFQPASTPERTCFSLISAPASASKPTHFRPNLNTQMVRIQSPNQPISTPLYLPNLPIPKACIGLTLASAPCWHEQILVFSYSERKW